MATKKVGQDEIGKLEIDINIHFARLNLPARLTNLKIDLEDDLATSTYSLMPTAPVDPMIWFSVCEVTDSKIEEFLRSRGIRSRRA